jgi:DNA-binding protein H-NS
MPRKKKEPTELSVQELQGQLAQMEADRKALEAALRKQRAAERSGFAREIRDQIVARGYTVDEVASLLGKGGRKGGGSRRSAGYPQYVDPDNPANTYTRGPVPEWLKEKMRAAGYDPADRAQRDQFKAEHLELVA